MFDKKLLFLLLPVGILLSGCTQPVVPPILKPCSLFPFDSDCTCPPETVKQQDNVPIPEAIGSIPFKCINVTEATEYKWKIQSSSTGVHATGYYCRRTIADSPFAGGYPFSSNQECLSTLASQLGEWCVLEVEFPLTHWVMIPVGDKVVCNPTTDYHRCDVEGWVVEDSSVRTTGASYCPATEVS